ncbi:MAG: CopG family transcriptional regulator [Bacteroidota bacterium]
MLNVRLSKDQEKKLNDYCYLKDVSKSQVVKEALAMYLSSNHSTKSPYELGHDLFGKEKSGESIKSVTYKESLKKKLNEKYPH